MIKELVSRFSFENIKVWFNEWGQGRLYECVLPRYGLEFHTMDSCLNDVFMSSMQWKDVFPKNTKRRVQYDKRCSLIWTVIYTFMLVMMTHLRYQKKQVSRNKKAWNANDFTLASYSFVDSITSCGINLTAYFDSQLWRHCRDNCFHYK